MAKTTYTIKIQTLSGCQALRAFHTPRPTLYISPSVLIAGFGTEKWEAMNEQKDSVTKKNESISDRIAKYEVAFNNGRLLNHLPVSTFVIDDAEGQRGWGPMMQT